MIDCELFDDVISEFAKDETFTRFTTVTNALGREEKTAIVPSLVIFCYIHPASDNDLVSVTQQGYHPEAMIKIFTRVDADILKDDEVLYNGENYREMKVKKKIVGDYKKFFAELLKP